MNRNEQNTFYNLKSDRLTLSLKSKFHQSLLSKQLSSNLIKINHSLKNNIKSIPSLNETSLLDVYTTAKQGIQSTDGLNVESESKKRMTRKRLLPKTPDRVLDAPGLIDDFYLNAFDWSCRNVLAIGLSSSVYLWNGADGGSVKELVNIPDSQSYCSSLSWIHDGRTVAVGTSTGVTQLWDYERTNLLRTMIVSPGSRVSSLAWNKHLLSTGSKNGKIQTHDVRVAKHLVSTHRDKGGEVCGLAWNTCQVGNGFGDFLAAGSNDNVIDIWDHRDGTTEGAEPFCTLEGHCSAIKAISWCPTRRGVLATGGGSSDRHIKIWDSRLSDPLLDSHDVESQVSGLAWIYGDTLIAAHGYDRNHLSVWELSGSGSGITHIGDVEGAHDGRILSMSARPGGSGQVATSAADESIKFWEIPKAIGTSSSLDVKFKKN